MPAQVRAPGAFEICTRPYGRTNMARWRLIACLVVVALAVCRADGQTGSPALQKELDGIRAMHKVLEDVIGTEGLQDDMPFAKFLDELARRVAKTGKLTVRIE